MSVKGAIPFAQLKQAYLDGKLGEHFLLHSAEDFGEVDLGGVGSAGHGGSRVAE